MENKLNYKPVFTFDYYNRSLALTREGAGFIILVFGIGLGAINTGNNLLYLILAMCCSFIAVSGTLSELTLKQIQASAEISKTLYYDEAYPLRLKITNEKKRAPSFSLNFSLPGSTDHRYLADRKAYLFHLPAGKTVEKNLLLKGIRRGPLDIDVCRITTSFPFGFFVKTRDVPIQIHSIVLPKIEDVELPPAFGDSIEGEHNVQTSGDELFSIREFHPGDPVKSIHWKSTARTGVLKVKEFLSGGKRSYNIFLNLYDADTDQRTSQEKIEKRISEAASLVYHLIKRGDEAALKTPDYQSASDNSEAHLEELLRRLALIGYEKSASPEVSASRFELERIEK